MSDADVFCLTDDNGKLLDPAVQATVLAKYSRSPLSAREIVKTLTTEEADKFQDKWVNTYSHSSVSELAQIPICFENVSIVASKFIESWQRPGYSEKSTRYQKFSADSFITPPGAPSTMKEFSKRFYEGYDRLLPKITRRIAQILDKDPNDPSVLADRIVKARAFDNARYLLPAGTGTNIGYVGNARDIRYFISQALGSHNPEFRSIGAKTKEALMGMCPVFAKVAEPDNFEPQIRNLGRTSPKFDFEKPSWNVDWYRPHLLGDALLIRRAFQAQITDLYGMSWETFTRVMEDRGKRAVPRIFRTVKLSYDIMMDYGAYRDLQRHRRCEIFPEFLGTDYGYLVPDDIVGTEIEDEYREIMDSVDLYEDEAVVHDRELLQYMIPLGYLHRSIFEMDLAELYYIAELRTQPQGHISYRRVAYEMFALAKQRYPELLAWCRAIEPKEIGIHN